MVWHQVPGAPQCQSQRPHAAGRHHHSSAGLLILRNRKLSQDPVRNLHSQETNLTVLGQWMPQDCASRVETLVGAAFGGTAATPPKPCIAAELKHPPQLNKPESGGEQIYWFICTLHLHQGLVLASRAAWGWDLLPPSLAQSVPARATATVLVLPGDSRAYNYFIHHHSSPSQRKMFF